uniref:Uncharacterized protein n=1 Tax=Amphimedon queenslandica TaxID=400682 RepID=A0A1X7UB91_AMPQE
YSNYRDWHTYLPRFTNETCVTPMQVMLYLYHINWSVVKNSNWCCMEPMLFDL